MVERSERRSILSASEPLKDPGNVGLEIELQALNLSNSDAILPGLEFTFASSADIDVVINDTDLTVRVMGAEDGLFLFVLVPTEICVNVDSGAQIVKRPHIVHAVLEGMPSTEPEGRHASTLARVLRSGQEEMLH